MTAGQPEQEPVTVTDKRRIDPDTFEVRDPDARSQPVEETDTEAPAAGEHEEAALAAEPSPESAQLAERTADLQRLTAEYANYRRRVERERVVTTEAAKASVVTQLLDVVDDLDRARAHGDLEQGPLKSVADKLTGVLSGLGLQPFGDPGDAFDPEIHEAVHMEGDGANPVLDTVLRKGYRLGERILRHAMVTVTDTVLSGDPPAEKPDSGADDE
ncbi:nucleotide exchange factor GrpE [Rhodococcus ruber]|uniref:nucleotide exchange factor GrpE n=1 Tax=Rhodococcus ruber TaxID=1830 RepID=UPI0007CD4D7C|nr:nucleotide exchange factor GrpE [Rhodococcus ruber]AWH00490.1 nucleotide exchange factor GrpE [Rhodococcus ruber]MDO1480719.1 nucleotide exchange factor GrpE [Rhodococcus ruber]